MNKEILPIKRNQFHFCKFHVFCNPDHYMIHEYLSCHWRWHKYSSKKIKKDHVVHIFIAWITGDEITDLTDFLSFLSQKSKKVIMHIPRSIDEHTAEMIAKAIKMFNVKGFKNFKVYAEHDRNIVSFNMSNIDGDGILQITSDNMHSYTWRKISKNKKDSVNGGWMK